MSDDENAALEKLATIYLQKISSFYAEKVPGLTLDDPVLVMVRLMASKKPNSLIKAMLLSEKVETVVPKNFRYIFNGTYPKRLKIPVDNSTTIFDILLDPVKQNITKNLTEIAIQQQKAIFEKMDKKVSMPTLFKILWYSTLPCFDLINTTSYRRNQKSLLKRCSWKGVEIPCEAIFSTFPTDRGMCCSFNMKAADDIFKNKIYSGTRALQNIFSCRKRNDPFSNGGQVWNVKRDVGELPEEYPSRIFASIL